MKNEISYMKLSAIFLVLTAIDQITKLWAEATLKDKEPFVIIDGVFEFNFLEGGNTGGAWGILSGNIWLLINISIFIAIFITALIVKIQKMINSNYSLNINTLKLYQLMFVILLAGAAGNLIDRIFRGYVIDFIYFKLINFPIFNVADCYVTVMCVVFLVYSIFFVNEDDFNKIFSFKKVKED